MIVVFFFFQAEDGIRDAQESRGLGDVYKRQMYAQSGLKVFATISSRVTPRRDLINSLSIFADLFLSLIHI